MNIEAKMADDVYVEPHKAARPMVVVVDDEGTPWLCDKEVNPEFDLSDQGCWNCGEIAFTRND